MTALFIAGRKQRRPTIWAPLVFAAAALASGPGALAAAKGEAHVIKIESMQFVPNSVEVHVGDTVTWKNADPFPHTVVSSGKGFASREIAADGSWKFVARKKGSYPYICTLHPTMKGTLVVQ